MLKRIKITTAVNRVFEKKMEKITLVFPPLLQYLELATTLSRKICNSLPYIQMNKEFINAVEVAVSEACTNVIRHAPQTSADVMISFQIFPDKLVVQIKDKGVSFDFHNVPLPDFENHPEHGYGIYLMKSLMDRVEYSAGNEGNILSMTKYF